MCGIAGVASREPVATRATLACACDAIQHRGPDDAGEWWSDDGRVGLGFRRLAIIDLTPTGHQPMAAGPRLHIVFNGEIYNYRDLRDELLQKGHSFVSQSDTEVILAAYREWGTDCLSRLNGMFALAIHDEDRRQLFLARDRAGEKPLFYFATGGSIRFASELKALLSDSAVPRRANREAVDCYLAMGFVPGNRCVLDGLNKLSPAHALTFNIDSGAVRIWRYWGLPALAPGADKADETQLLDELEALLEDAVRRQLVADVPVGILLSGGVDSSLITAMASRASSKVKTFTIRFPGHARYDEAPHARLIASHFGTEQIELEAAEATADLLPLLARQFDEPIIDSSMIPTHLVSQLVRRHCTVAIGGDGGDELFGGYQHHNRLLLLRQRVQSIPRPICLAVSAAAAVLPIGFKGRNWLQAAGGDLDNGLPLIASYFDRAARHRLLPGRSGWPYVAEEVRAARIPAASDLLQRATRMDFEHFLAEDILVKVDRASMLNSLEVRAPLLDYRVIEFAFGRVPSRLKATATSRKILLKQLAARVLPPEFDRQRKQGFSIPLSSWLSGGPWQTLFRDVLLGAENTTFDRDFCRSLLEGQARGRSNSERLFGLVLFEIWRRSYRVSI